MSGRREGPGDSEEDTAGVMDRLRVGVHSERRARAVAGDASATVSGAFVVEKRRGRLSNFFGPRAFDGEAGKRSVRLGEWVGVCADTARDESEEKVFRSTKARMCIHSAEAP